MELQRQLQEEQSLRQSLASQLAEVQKELRDVREENEAQTVKAARQMVMTAPHALGDHQG